jgi:two-component system chemotaxis response regulator CheB
MDKIKQVKKEEDKEGKNFHVIVIGTSAGGLSALKTLISQFDNSLNIAVLIVVHLSYQSVGDYLIHHLQPCTPFTCKFAEDGELIKKHVIYIAPPNKHLLVKEGRILLGSGPRENHWRPSIDNLFRSAASVYDSHVTGIILTGMLNDGVSGMMAIKRSGGSSIVQDPAEAEFPDMPLAVLNNMDVNFSISLVEMKGAIQTLIKKSSKVKKEDMEIPFDVKVEAKLAERMSTAIRNTEEIGKQTVFSCPDCGGGLWEIEKDPVRRYRCHTGHVYYESDLSRMQVESIEETLWVALRMMEERRNLLQKMSESSKDKGMSKTIAFYEEKIKEIDVHIGRIKEILYATQENEISEG